MSARFASYAFLLFMLASCGCSVTRLANKPSAASFFGIAVDGYPISERHTTDIPHIGGRQPDLIVFYLQWPLPGTPISAPFPLDSARRIWDSGAVPCITWEPMYIEGDKEVAVLASSITGGDYDTYIRKFATDAAQWGHPVLIRFAHEMNLRRYHWGTTEEGYGPASPAIYRAMYQHVVNVATAAGATNLLWVFCANAESMPSRNNDPAFAWNVAANYYPGSAFVDVLGLDGYNWGKSRVQKKHGWTSQHRTFAEIFETPARELRTFEPVKPLLVFETASVGTPEQKVQWFEDAMRSCPRLGISGLVWFQATKENDWSLPNVVGAAAVIESGAHPKAMRDWIKEMRR